MTIDTRRELNHIFREMGHYHNKVGESVIWFKFDTSESAYDDVYDENGRSFLPGIAVPILWVDQIESREEYSPEGRRPTQRIRLALSARSAAECGLDPTEAHGGRLKDTKPSGKPWWDDRLNDILYYDSRYYEISNFGIRGRARGDVVIAVAGIETQPEDELVFDSFPTF